MLNDRLTVNLVGIKIVVCVVLDFGDEDVGKW
jgi:hypothetical protein